MDGALPRCIRGRDQFRQARTQFYACAERGRQPGRHGGKLGAEDQAALSAQINRFTVDDGELHYRDFHTSPKVDVVFDRFRIVATNLTNSEKLSKTLHANIQMEARPLREGDVRTKMDLDPYAAKPTFNLETELKELPLVKLNDFAKAYAGITFEKGTLRLATEMNARHGDFDGYIEPVFEHMSIFNPAHDAENPISFVWQAIVGGLTKIIRNHPTDRWYPGAVPRQLR